MASPNARVTSPLENWWHTLLAAILLVLPQGWGEPFLERAGRWAPVWAMGPCAVYLLLVEPVGPFLFLSAISSAWAIARVEIVSASEWTEVPRWIRKVAAAVLRATRMRRTPRPPTSSPRGSLARHRADGFDLSAGSGDSATRHGASPPSHPVRSFLD